MLSPTSFEVMTSTAYKNDDIQQFDNSYILISHTVITVDN